MVERRLSVFALIFLIATLTFVWGGRTAGVDAQSDSAHRFGEAVVLVGADAEALIGLEAEQIWGYAYSELEKGFVPVRIQVDERDDKGVFVEREDGIFDENDEVVAMFADLGTSAPKGGWPEGIPGGAPAVEVMVTDPLLDFPLDPAAAAWLYLFATGRPADHDLPDPIMRHDVDAGFMGSPDYEMIFASARDDRFIGPKELRAFGSNVDLIDRFKIRMTLIVLFGLSRQEVNEEDIAAQSGSLGLTDPPRRLGPLRVVLDDQGLNQAFGSRVTLFRGAFDESDLPPGVDGIDAVRLSLDLSPEAIGSRYHDSNLEVAGVPIDGVPDAVPARPIPAWRWIELPGGQLIFLASSGASGSKAKNVYRDGGDPEEGDTGDGRHVGEAGVDADSVDAFVKADFPGEMIFASSERKVDVTRLVEEAAMPLEWTVKRWGDAPAPVTGTATVTVTSTSTPTPTIGGSPTKVEATPTLDAGGEDAWQAYLPMLGGE